LSLLDKINSPADLKKIPTDQLELLASEIREKILNVVSQNGGHLSSNLGLVELSIALHYVFDAPKDKIIWDTGHQAYTHKLLTGRRDSFDSLRQTDGISGFLRRVESPYDIFGAGHEGTGLSAALGVLEARDHHKEKAKVVVLIGDATLTVGMSLEALNYAGHLQKDLIVILNDNEMSISKNVGAISSYLSRIISGHFYNRIKKDAELLLKSIPTIGKPMLKVAKRAEELVKGLIGPGILFEELGFTYVGPIEGHRFDYLLSTLENVKRLNAPCVVHVITKKGKGYAPAEKDPVSFHSAPPFDLKTGEVKKKPKVVTYTKVFTKALVELAKKDKRIVAITAAMPEGTGLAGFGKEFPNRFYDVGIAEQHAVTFAGGLAAGGMHPVVGIYSTFMQRAYDQILHDICLQNLPVTLCLDRAGLVGEDGHTHHGMFDIAYLRSIPNIVVMSPKDENELRHMLRTALTYPGPIAMRYPRGEGIGVPMDDRMNALSIGKSELLMEGKDLAIFALGSMVYPSLGAAGRLKQDGISAAVINSRFVKPVDREMILTMARKCKRIVTVEEGILNGGFGSAVWETLEEEGLSGVEIRRIGLPDDFIDHGPAKLLRQKFGLDADGITRRVLEFMGDKIGVTKG
jgi:1-deoxy-D-xylulose-5-phosphate synthase